jgi:hypothetical protein
MTICDLCGKPKECLQRQIDYKEFDICAACWKPLAEKLAGKGRAASKERETVFLPPRIQEPERPQPVTRPGEPPKIF